MDCIDVGSFLEQVFDLPFVTLWGSFMESCPSESCRYLSNVNYLAPRVVSMSYLLRR